MLLKLYFINIIYVLLQANTGAAKKHIGPTT